MNLFINSTKLLFLIAIALASVIIASCARYVTINIDADIQNAHIMKNNELVCNAPCTIRARAGDIFCTPGFWAFDLSAIDPLSSRSQVKRIEPCYMKDTSIISFVIPLKEPEIIEKPSNLNKSIFTSEGKFPSDKFYSIALIDIESSGIELDYKDMIMEQVETILKRNDNFVMIDRSKIEDVENDQKNEEHICKDNICCAAIGKSVNADKVLSFSLKVNKAGKIVDLKFTDVSTGNIEAQVNGICTNCSQDFFITNLKSLIKKPLI